MKKGSQERLDEMWSTIDSMNPAAGPKFALKAYYDALTAAERTTMSAAMSQGSTYAVNPLGKANEKVMRRFRRALILILMAKHNSGVVANDLASAQAALAGNMSGDEARQRCVNELPNVQSAITNMKATARADINWGGWDGRQQRPLRAGCAIGRRGANGPGTLGCFLIDGTGAIYILSNRHVLYQGYAAGGTGPGADNLVIQPPHQLGGSYFDDVATLFADDPVHDAAIARVKAGIICSNTTVNGIVIGGSAAATNNGSVRKDGCASRLRRGIVTTLNSANIFNGSVNLIDQLIVDIDAGNDANPQRIFQIQGDSGSVLIDHNNDVVALMHGQASAVQAQATHIAPILAHFNMQVMVGVHTAQ
ncbi:MAG TPA: hypothetical protein VMV40_10190 [Acidiferrobacter sp.]|nr:hypothetical protein [Acidiferrobacter sp.]